MTRLSAKEDGLTSNELDSLDLEAKRFEKTNPKVFQVMQAAQEAGVRPAYILYALRGGDDSYLLLRTVTDFYTEAAYIVSITEQNIKDGLPASYREKRFHNQILEVQTHPGVDPVLVKQTFDVLRKVYPEYSANIPA